MIARLALVLTLALGACWTPPRAPDGTVAIPGAIWTTPAKPWRVPAFIAATVVDGDTALVALGDRRVARVDLTTGLVLRTSPRLPELGLRRLVHLADGRWLATGERRGGFAGVTLDPITLAPTPLPIRGHATIHARGHLAAQLADGRVLLAGPGLPVAAYDPSTWRVVTRYPDLAEASVLVVDTDAIVALRGAGVTRTPFAGGSTSEPHALRGSPQAAAHGAILSLAWDSASHAFSGQVTLAGGGTLELPAPVDAMALAPDGQRVAVLAAGHLRVQGLDAQHLHAPPIADVDLGDGGHPGSGTLVFADRSRVLIAAGTMLRVVDLAAGTASPDTGPPYATTALAVADDGRVLAVGARAWLFDGGRPPQVGADFSRTEVAEIAAGELGRVVTTERHVGPGDRGEHAQPARLVIRDAMSGAAVRTLPLAGDADLAWTSAEGGLVVSETEPYALWRTQASGLQLGTYYKDAVIVADVDVAGDTAMMMLGGDANLVRIADGAPVLTLPTPACGGSSGELERHGRRALIVADDLYVWDRVTGDLIGSLHVPEPAIVGDGHLVPGHDEVLIDLGDAVALWSVHAGELRTIPLASQPSSAVSPDGKRAALVLADGRAALLDLELIRATIRPTAAPEAAEPGVCPGGDPAAEPPAEAPPVDTEPNDGDDDGGTPP